MRAKEKKSARFARQSATIHGGHTSRKMTSKGREETLLLGPLPQRRNTDVHRAKVRRSLAKPRGALSNICTVTSTPKQKKYPCASTPALQNIAPSVLVHMGFSWTAARSPTPSGGPYANDAENSPEQGADHNARRGHLNGHPSLRKDYRPPKPHHGRAIIALAIANTGRKGYKEACNGSVVGEGGSDENKKTGLH